MYHSRKRRNSGSEEPSAKRAKRTKNIRPSKAYMASFLASLSDVIPHEDTKEMTYVVRDAMGVKHDGTPVSVDDLAGDQEKAEAFFANLSTMQSVGDGCDVVLQGRAQNESIPCHRVMLAAASPTFKFMFTSNGLQREGSSPLVFPNEEKVIKLALDYIYNREVEVDSHTVALDLLHFADQWALDHLATSCIAFIRKRYAKKAGFALDILKGIRLLHDTLEIRHLVSTCVTAVLWDPESTIRDRRMVINAFDERACMNLLARDVLPSHFFSDESAVAWFVFNCAHKWHSDCIGHLLDMVKGMLAPEEPARANKGCSERVRYIQAVFDRVRWGECNQFMKDRVAKAFPFLTGAASPDLPPRAFSTEQPKVIKVGERPESVAVDPEGRIVVADLAKKMIHVLAEDGSLLAKWGLPSMPTRVRVDGEGRIIVLCPMACCIYVFTGDGRSLAEFGSEGDGDGQFRNPTDVAVDGEGRILVVDAEKNEIQVFAADGTFLGKWGSKGHGDGQFWGSVGVAVDGEGRIIVADWGNNRIQVFAADGTFLAKWGTEGTDAGEIRGPENLAVDGHGRIIVIDGHGIQAFAVDGTFLEWGEYPDDPWNRPHDVTVDDEGDVMAAYPNHSSIKIFRWKEQ
jgi:sugar lactone lactonase YvrE